MLAGMGEAEGGRQDEEGRATPIHETTPRIFTGGNEEN